MSLLNTFTGGKDQEATDALNKAYSVFDGVGTPTAEQLSLPELQKYVQAGLLTPEQAVAALQGGNAYDNINNDPRSREASIDALSKLQEIGDAGGHDAQSEAALSDTESKMNQTLQGQRGSILDQMDQRGIPSSLMGVAAQLAAAGQDSEQAHQDALHANADASTRALQALEASGSMGNTISGQQDQEAQSKASAQNAINQWNAANQTTVNMNNAAMRQQADNYNQQVAQQASSANTQNANARTQYNAQVPQTIYQDKLAKAGGEAGVAENQAANATQQGQQNAGLYSGIIGAGMTLVGGPAAGAAATALTSPKSSGGSGTTNQPDQNGFMAHGGVVPGHPNVPGDSMANDKVPAMLSPGEVVVPRTAAHDPQTALAFIKHLHRQTAQGAAHPDDVKSVLHALGSMRQGG